MRPWALRSQCPWDETQEDFLQEGGLGVVWSRGHQWALWRTTQLGCSGRRGKWEKSKQVHIVVVYFASQHLREGAMIISILQTRIPR